jgi:hypothetical protein
VIDVIGKYRRGLNISKTIISSIVGSIFIFGSTKGHPSITQFRDHALCRYMNDNTNESIGQGANLGILNEK